VDDQDDDRYSRAPEPGDVVRICRALNDTEARYLLIGGFAVVAHGAGRFTKDIDLLIDDSPENVARVKRALAVLPDNAAREVDENDVRAHTVVRVCDEVVVDLMGRACGLDYAEAVRDAETIDREGVTIRIASPATLIKLKDTARPQDALDRSFLEGVIAERQSRKRHPR
jgi:hypothetical protein